MNPNHDAETQTVRSDAEKFRAVLANQGLKPGTFSLFRKIILSLYERAGRDLAWRHTTDPYHILVSEIMLQQTQVERVRRKYPEFLAAFPLLTELADAPLSKVLFVWQGMGYNRRAIALQACAKKIVSEFGGTCPSDINILSTLPGIGHATACSISAFAFNNPVVFIETNIRRVFIHFFFDKKTQVPDREILPLVEQALYKKNPRVWYWAVMDYGSMLKRTVANPNRQSAHYEKQSKFKGSDREIRGMILKELLDAGDLYKEELIQKSGTDPVRLKRILCALIDEGFIVTESDTIHITGEKEPCPHHATKNGHPRNSLKPGAG
jgi:A/G-specific adenine glycosylase